MKNKEKYAKEIFEIACEGHKIAFNKKRTNCPSAHALIAQIIFLKSVLVMKMQETGVNLSMLNRPLIGAKFRLTRRYLLEMETKKNLRKGTLQNMRMKKSTRGIWGLHLGQQMIIVLRLGTAQN